MLYVQRHYNRRTHTHTHWRAKVKASAAPPIDVTNVIATPRRTIHSISPINPLVTPIKSPHRWSLPTTSRRRDGHPFFRVVLQRAIARADPCVGKSTGYHASRCFWVAIFEKKFSRF